MPCFHLKIDGVFLTVFLPECYYSRSRSRRPLGKCPKCPFLVSILLQFRKFEHYACLSNSGKRHDIANNQDSQSLISRRSVPICGIGAEQKLKMDTFDTFRVDFCFETNCSGPVAVTAMVQRNLSRCLPPARGSQWRAFGARNPLPSAPCGKHVARSRNSSQMFNGDFLIWGDSTGAVCGALCGNFTSARSIDGLCFAAKFPRMIDLIEFP